MSAVSRRTDQAVARTPPPPACALCGGAVFTVRFPATATGDDDGHGAARQADFSCTSFGHRRHGTVWECAGCGLVVQWPQPSEGELEASYRAVEDPLYTAERANRYLTFRRVVHELGEAHGRHLLDVGAYCGYFLDVAREAGFDAEGLELSTWAAGCARSLGFTVHEDRLGERIAAGDTYDVITMWDVLEHLADPVAELAAAHELLVPGGRLYLSTVDVDSRFARLMGARWPWLMEMHLIYFNRATVRRALEQAGFRHVATHAYTHVVSASYLVTKVAATFPAVAAPLRRLAAHVPERWRVPVNVGDNLLVVAESPG